MAPEKGRVRVSVFVKAPGKTPGKKPAEKPAEPVGATPAAESELTGVWDELFISDLLLERVRRNLREYVLNEIKPLIGDQIPDEKLLEMADKFAPLIYEVGAQDAAPPPARGLPARGVGACLIY